MTWIIQIGFARSRMYNSIVGKAQSRITSHYQLKGNIAEEVQWLIERSHFIYGEVAAEVPYSPLNNYVYAHCLIEQGFE